MDGMHRFRGLYPKFGVLLGLGLVLCLALAGCQSAATATASEPPPAPPEPTQPPPEPTPTELPDQSAFIADWEAGPHAHNYDLGKGPNTYCSRCHSPQNWDPASTIGLPPNCNTCKFPTDAELRIATTMDFVEEADWVGISCESCHQMENGVVVPGLAWLNTATDTYEVVSTPNELCGKCHANTSGVSVSGGTGVTHAIDLGGSAHLDWAGEWPQSDRPQYCSDCHNPHNAEPMQCVECHTEIPTSDTHMNGLNALMLDKVDCMACHDASGMEIGPSPLEADGGRFVTVVNAVSRSGGMTTTYTKSHSIQWQVSCDRCHFEGNPWERTVLTADGKPPAE
jgi:hypothetical protein